MMTEVATSKSAASVAGAGLIASIAQDPNFWVLAITALVVSTLSYAYDYANSHKKVSFFSMITEWSKYILSGLGAMFLVFYGLVFWVSEVYQLPDTVWYMVAMVASGYSVSIIEWGKITLPAVITKIVERWVK